MLFSSKNREITTKIIIAGLLLITALLPLQLVQAAPDLPEPQHTMYALKTLTLNDAIMLALRNNPTVQVSEIQRIADKFAYEVARNQFQPQYSLTGAANYSAGASPAYNLMPQVSLNSPFGTNITTNVNDTFNGNAQGTVTITQPLLAGFGPTVTQAALFTAYITELNARLTFKNSTIATVVAVIKAYRQVVQDTNALITNESALATSEQSLSQTNLEIKAGKKARTDAIQQAASVATNKLQVEQAENTLQQSYQSLINLLGLDPNAQLKIVQTIVLDERPLPTLEQSIQIAIANNVTYKQLLNSYQVAERTLAVAKNAQLPTLNAVATASNNVLESGGNTPSTRSLVFNMSVPINNMQLKQQLVNAKVSLEQAQLTLYNAKRTLTTQVINAYQNLMSQREQIVLSENDVELAQQSLQVENLRYTAGLDPPINLIQARNDLQAKELNLIDQKISYLNNLEDFFALLGTTLERWNIQLTY